MLNIMYKLAVVMVLCFVCPHQLNATSLDDLYQEGLKYRDNKKYKEAGNCFFPLATAGDLKAQHNLGLCFYYLNEEKQAYYWWNMAVKQGFHPSINNINRMNLFYLLLSDDLIKRILSFLKPKDSCQFNLVSKRAHFIGTGIMKFPELKIVMGQPVSQLQAMGARVSYPWIESSFCNILKVENGELKVLGSDVAEETQAQYFERYNTLNSAGENLGGYITNGPLRFQGASVYNKALFTGLAEIDLQAEKENSGEDCIYRSNGNIKLTGSFFRFEKAFFDVDVSKTVITFYPSPRLKSPIEFLQIYPKKSPLLIEGEFDFRNLSFKNFIISYADFVLQFK